MKILISGASGFIGKGLIADLSRRGHQTVPLHRKRAGSLPFWDIKTGEIDLGTLNDIDIVIHLAGENIASGRWTAAKKRRILESRVEGTTLLCSYFSQRPDKPKVIISASAVGFYGHRDDELLDENSGRGSGFLAEVCARWEAATKVASDAGIRVVNIRFGMVLSLNGGALTKMVSVFKTGLGGPVGCGKQWTSWITLADACAAISHIMATTELQGAVNLVSPRPVTNHQFTKILGSVLKRPTLLPLPAFVAKLLLGDMAEELLLSSTRAVPGKLVESGYLFSDPSLEQALHKILRQKELTENIH